MNQFIAQILLMGFNFAPRQWSICQGQILAIAQNQALFALIGTTYGGNGVQTFALPDLRGRTPIGTGQGPGTSNYNLGQVGGTETVTMNTSQLPYHTHSLTANNGAATLPSPAGNLLGQAPLEGTTQINFYGTSSNATMNPAALANAGSNLPISILQPYTVLSYCIATQGIFPSRN
ncbi:MAG: hypothetical protein JWP44_3009 [Mucilaginibacter sp.]|nr:hypothetical protein [Mucilaginibacter sp.]